MDATIATLDLFDLAETIDTGHRLGLVASYGGTDPLKAIVMTGVVTDLYTLLATPQGAFRTSVPAMQAFRWSEVTALPPLTPPLSMAYGAIPVEGDGTGYGLDPANLSYFVDQGHVRADRLCPDVARTLGEPAMGQLTDERDRAFYDERRFLDRAGDVRAAVLMAHGFLDTPPHGFQENLLWHALDERAPKRQIEGQWGHSWPEPSEVWPDVTLDTRWEHSTWPDIVFDWLDYWLKGIGSVERLGTVDYQDSAGVWRESEAWPPPAAHDEVLYLSGRTIAPEPAATSAGPRTFRSAPHPANAYHNARFAGASGGPWATLCPDPGTAAAPSAANTSGLLYLGEPLAEDVVIAGNPFAYLALSSDQPGGSVTLNLLDVGPDFACDAAGRPTGIREFSAGTSGGASGAADLRFHAGNFTGTDFPVGQPAHVRVELFDGAEVLEAGHRLGLIVSYGDGAVGWANARYFPTIGVHDDMGILSSQLVIPVLEGTLGGHEPVLDYPARPFAGSGR